MKSPINLIASAVAMTSMLFSGHADAQTCTATPTTISNFSAADFAGNWFMQASTFYANDEFGCITFSISEPNTVNKLDAGLRMTQLWSFNPLQSGRYVAQTYSLDYDTSGNMTYKRGFVINNTFYSVLDTDYDNYAIVYQCSRNYPKFLNFRNDDVHILTRASSVTDANWATWLAAAGETETDPLSLAESKVTGSEARFETLLQSSCLSPTYRSKMTEAFSDPETFFRKW